MISFLKNASALHLFARLSFGKPEIIPTRLRFSSARQNYLYIFMSYTVKFTEETPLVMSILSESTAAQSAYFSAHSLRGIQNA